MPNEILWWGYIHRNGTIHVKRYFGPEDLEEAYDSPFVLRHYGPWHAANSEEAWKILTVILRLSHKRIKVVGLDEPAWIDAKLWERV